MKRPNWIKENEAAEKFGLRPRTLRQHVKNGILNVAFTNVNGRNFQYNITDIEKILLDNSTFIR